MIPAKVVYDDIANEVASATLLSEAASKMHLVLQPFVPTQQMVNADISAHYGSGSLAAVAAGGFPFAAVDPNTNQQFIGIVPPVGGFKWTYDGASPTPPALVYGIALTDSASANLLATEAFAAPITLNASGQAFILDAPQLLQVLQPYS